MEKHIFKFGSSSTGIVLPKKWIEKNRLSKSDSIFISENEKGDLVLSAKGSGKVSFTKSVDRDTNADILATFVGLYYKIGINKLTIHSKDGLTKRQIQSIHDEIVDECPGFEIISQSSNEVQIEDFTDMKEVNVDKVIGRLRSLLNQQFDELRQGNLDTVVSIEGLVDRFYMLGVRYVNIIQPKDIIKYYRVIVLMENMADDLMLLAPNLERRHMKMIEKVQLMFEMSEKGFNGDQKTILELELMREGVKKELESLKLDKVYRRMLKHVATAATQIAEFGLLKEDQKYVISP